MGNIKIEKMVLGMVQTNTWFVINEKTKELILIDPADDAGRIIRKIEADGLKLQGILLTHGHFDHIMAADEVRKKYNIPPIQGKANPACRCGDVLQGKCKPSDCKVFGKVYGFAVAIILMFVKPFGN